MRKPAVVHPFLFAVFPALFFFTHNMERFSPTAVLAPAGKMLLAAAAGLVLFAILLGNWRKAAVLVSLLTVLFTSYGYLAAALRHLQGDSWGAHWWAHAVLIPSYAVAVGLAAYFTVRTPSDLRNITKVLNAAAACLVAISAFNMGAYAIKTGGWGAYSVGDGPAPAVPADVPQPASLPNVYYIILDAYARDDNLADLYDYDNSEFLDYLKTKGFYVAGKSRTNYSHTTLSLASSLNLEYLDGLVEQIGDETNDRAALRRMIADSKVRQFLGNLGYHFVVFQSGFGATAIKTADLCLSLEQMGEFERGFWGTTAASSAKRQRQRDRERILYTFQKLPATAQLPGPLFVFAHVVAPHPPFVFTAEGEDVGGEKYYRMKSASGLICPSGITRREYMRLYKQQLTFINKLLMKAIDGILAQSRIPPIIVVQGDHGPGTFVHHNCMEATYLKDRMSILNAYYLPGRDAPLYESITPVNTFRVILNAYFGTRYEPLEDTSYFATDAHPYRFINVDAAIGSETDRKRLEVLMSMDYYPSSISPDRRAKAVKASNGDETGS